LFEKEVITEKEFVARYKKLDREMKEKRSKTDVKGRPE